MRQLSDTDNQVTLALANLVGQIGCATSIASLVIVGLAFGGGYLIDNQFGTSPIFTFLFLLGSFPVTLYVIVRLSLSALERSQKLQERIRQQQKLQEQELEEESNNLEDRVNGFSESY